MKSIKLKLIALFAVVATAAICVSMFGFAETAHAESDGMAALEMCEQYLANHAFTTELRGEIRARAFAIPFKQTVCGGRDVNGENFTCTDESRSALANVGYKRSGGAGGYFVSTAEYKKKKFVYGEPREYDYDGYVSAYGLPPTSLSKFVTDGTVTSFERIDERTYKFVLEPVSSTEFCVNQIKTVLNCSSPTYKYVEITVETDGVRPVCVKTYEKFHADKFGGINCTAEYTETFKYN